MEWDAIPSGKYGPTVGKCLVLIVCLISREPILTSTRVTNELLLHMNKDLLNNEKRRKYRRTLSFTMRIQIMQVEREKKAAQLFTRPFNIGSGSFVATTELVIERRRMRSQ